MTAYVSISNGLSKGKTLSAWLHTVQLGVESAQLHCAQNYNFKSTKPLTHSTGSFSTQCLLHTTCTQVLKAILVKRATIQYSRHPTDKWKGGSHDLISQWRTK